MTTAADTEATYYVLFDDGSVSIMTSTTGEPPLPKPGRFVDQAEYEARQEEVRAAREEYVAELQAEDERRTREDYEALRAAGVPESTARRLSGYTGPETDA